MERKSFADMDCSIAQCLEVVGEWWSLLIIRDVFLGVRRYEALLERLGISRNILQARLRSLVDAGVLERRSYSSHPPRHEYHLTQKGRDLWPVLMTMREWGDRYGAPSGPPIETVHLDCDHVSTPILVCDQCVKPVGPRDMVAISGPGRSSGLESVRRSTAEFEARHPTRAAIRGS